MQKRHEGLVTVVNLPSRALEAVTANFITQFAVASGQLVGFQAVPWLEQHLPKFARNILSLDAGGGGDVRSQAIDDCIRVVRELSRHIHELRGDGILVRGDTHADGLVDGYQAVLSRLEALKDHSPVPQLEASEGKDG